MVSPSINISSPFRTVLATHAIENQTAAAKNAGILLWIFPIEERIARLEMYRIIATMTRRARKRP